MSFSDMLETLRPTDEALEQAVRLYMSEATNDMSPASMHASMVRAASADTVNEALEALAHRAALRHDLCVEILSVAWEDGDKRDAIEAALEGASEKMPVVEAGLIAMVAMYALYLLVTDGKVSEEVAHKPDGSYTRKTKWAGPVGPLKAVVALFAAKAQPSQKPHLASPSAQPPRLPVESSTPDGGEELKQ
jgi:hypothetical protein